MLFILAAATGIVAYQSKNEQLKQWYCASSVHGSRNSSVVVQFYVQADGTVVGKGVLWTPPMRAKAVGDRALRDLDLSVQYDGSRERKMGTPTSVDVAVLASADLTMLDDGTAKITLADGSSAKAPFDASEEIDSGPHYRAATIEEDRLLSRLENGGKAKLVVIGGKGQELLSIIYDLSGRAERDLLFRKAWKMASAKLAHPTECDKTNPDAPSLSIPVP